MAPTLILLAISYYYVLSSNETVTSQTGLDVNSIGVDFRNGGAQWSGSTVLIVGVVEKGIIGTNVREQNLQLYTTLKNKLS